MKISLSALSSLEVDLLWGFLIIYFHIHNLTGFLLELLRAIFITFFLYNLFLLIFTLFLMIVLINLFLMTLFVTNILFNFIFLHIFWMIHFCKNNLKLLYI